MGIQGRKISSIFNVGNDQCWSMSGLITKAKWLAGVSALIEEVMGSSLGRVELEENLQVFPLKLQIAREFVAPRLALIGDAAHVCTPLPGRGSISG